jgi:hypothetical protein
MCQRPFPEFDAASNVKNVNFNNVDFNNADFNNADFNNADFNNANFNNADFKNADFSNVDFTNADPGLVYPAYDEQGQMLKKLLFVIKEAMAKKLERFLLENLVINVHERYFSGAPLEGRLPALQTNIRLGWKCLLVANTLAYEDHS